MDDNTPPIGPGRNGKDPHRSVILHRGRRYQVRGQLRVGDKTYLIIRNLSQSPRQRYMVFDPDAGLKGGEMRALHVLPRSPHTIQQVDVLQRALERPRDNLPVLYPCVAMKDRVYLIYSWIDGEPLSKYFQDEKLFSVRQSYRLVRSLAHTLCILHDRANVIHGDLRPENLIRDSITGQLVMIDFGSAWLVERSVDREHGDGGTPKYQAPELQGNKRLVDFRSDQFSLSVIFYQMLTGQLPYGSQGGKAGLEENRSDILPQQTRPSLKSPERDVLSPALWRKLDTLVERGLQLDVKKRYNTKSEWLNAFKEIDPDINQSRKLSPVNDTIVRVIDWFTDRWTSRPNG